MAGWAVKSRLVQWTAVVAILIAICFAWLLLPVDDAIRRFGEWVRDLGFWGMVVFALVYVIVVVVLAPAAAMSIAAGFIFGTWGIPLVVAAATVGANLAFFLSRHIFREKVRLMVMVRPWFEAVDQAVKDEGWKVVALLRLSPLVPFGLQNYAFGVTAVGSLPYALATFFGIMPGTALYVYLGTMGHVALDGGEGGNLKLALLAAGLVASAGAIILVGRRAKAKLAEIGVHRDREVRATTSSSSSAQSQESERDRPRHAARPSPE